MCRASRVHLYVCVQHQAQTCVKRDCECPPLISALAMPPKKRRKSGNLRMSAIGLVPSQMTKLHEQLATCKSKLSGGTIELGFDATRYDTRTALRDFYADIERVATVSTSDGSDVRVSYADPAFLLNAVLAHNDEVYDVFQAAYDRCPCSADRPWRCIVGFDECWSGNPMVEGGRKAMVLSISFLEFAERDLHLLSKSCMWFTICVVQASLLKDVDGQWSCIFAQIIRQAFLCERDGLARDGAIVVCRGRAFKLVCKVSNMLADGDGWKQLLQWKGAKGMKCCPICDNVVSNADLAARSAQLCNVSCAMHSNFVVHDHATLTALVQNVFKHQRDFRDGNISKTWHDNFIMAAGYEPCNKGIWADADVADAIRVAETLTFDWVHCAVSDGFLCKEIVAYMQDPATGATIEAFETFCSIGWTFAEMHPVHVLRRVIIEQSLSGHKRPSISEMLGFISVLYFWVSSHADSIAKEALVKGIRVVSTIQHMKYARCERAGDIERRALELVATYKEYMVASVRSNDEPFFIPKHHWMWHVASQYVRDRGRVYDCLIVERLHRRVKKFSRGIINRSQFERSVLERLTAAHCFDAQLHDLSYLGGRRKRAPSLDTVRRLAPQQVRRASDRAVLQGNMQLRSGDFLRILGDSAFHGRVREMVELNSEHDIHAVIDAWEVHNKTDMSWSVLKAVAGGPVLISALGGNIHWQRAVAWHEVGSCMFTVLRST